MLGIRLPPIDDPLLVEEVEPNPLTPIQPTHNCQKYPPPCRHRCHGAPGRTFTAAFAPPVSEWDYMSPIRPGKGMRDRLAIWPSSEGGTNTAIPDGRFPVRASRPGFRVAAKDGRIGVEMAPLVALGWLKKMGCVRAGAGIGNGRSGVMGSSPWYDGVVDGLPVKVDIRAFTKPRMPHRYLGTSWFENASTM
ncbi:hypothetical protein HDU76_008834 [Blyttiomyces sp. JEL0837]|nr:hypothetical protein HDU76_008834 [Blyttiomyces sp. JEL0837]